jgi:predicted amidohydrolase YtcJ
MLIRRAQLEDGTLQEVRIEGGRIAAIGPLDPLPGEHLLDAGGGLLLPGLHDHHIHVAALAAALASVHCGPPQVNDAETFAACLRAAPGGGWLRATGYHESVAGLLDAAALDRIVPDRPLRVQHRSGRMWFLNSAGLAAVLAAELAPPGLERDIRGYTGRLFDEDAWLRRALRSRPPPFAPVGALLARAGVTGVTDMSPANDPAIAHHFAAEAASGALPQRVLLAGSPALVDYDFAGPLQLGPAKLHLHEADLPPLDAAHDFVHQAHAAGRAVAVHCTTRVELVYALALFTEAGCEPGDRIEHASLTDAEALADIAARPLAVVTQPHFVYERGDAYRTDVEPAEQPGLYRLRSWLDAGVPLAGGSDAPFGSADPWTAMAAAVSRRTYTGQSIGAAEALTPEQALDLYLRDPQDLRRRRRIAVAAAADLCLLAQPWAAVRGALSSARVRACFVGGRPIWPEPQAAFA